MLELRFIRENLDLVKDKMNARFKKHIDIYMGTDIQEAREWGRKKVTISYGLKPQKSETE